MSDNNKYSRLNSQHNWETCMTLNEHKILHFDNA